MKKYLEKYSDKIFIVIYILSMFFTYIILFNGPIPLTSVTWGGLFFESWSTYIFFLVQLWYLVMVVCSVLVEFSIKGIRLFGICSVLIYAHTFVTYYDKYGMSPLQKILILLTVILNIKLIIIEAKMQHKKEKKRLLSEFMTYTCTNRKMPLLVFAIILLIVINIIYIAIPKKSVYAYTTVYEHHSCDYQVSNDEAFDESLYCLVDNDFVDFLGYVFSYYTGAIFCSDRSGYVSVDFYQYNTNLDKDDCDYEYIETKTYYVDENGYIHFDMDWNYICSVYRMNVVIIAVCILLLAACLKCSKCTYKNY